MRLKWADIVLILTFLRPCFVFRQLALLAALAASGTPVVVLLVHGRPATFGPGNAVLDDLAALVVGWRPGEEGGPAFVNLLMGRANPSGRLTQNWYGTFRADFHHFDRIELDLRGNTHVRGAAFSCPRLKLADMVLI